MRVSTALACVMAMVVGACSDDGSPAASTAAPIESAAGPIESTVSVVPGPTLPGSQAPASPRLVGDARPTMPAGAPGALSATLIGAPRPYETGTTADGVQVSFVIWNLTDAPVDGQALDVTSDDPAADGETGWLLAMTPSHLDAGEWGLATFAFFSATPTAATTFTTTFRADDPVMSRAVDLAVSAVDAEGDAEGLRTATVTNPNEVPVASPYTLAVHCFQGDELVSVTTELIDAANNGFTFEPGAEVTAEFVTDPACERVLVGAVSFIE